MTKLFRNLPRVAPVSGVFAAAQGDHDAEHDRERRRAAHQPPVSTTTLAQHSPSPGESLSESTIVELGAAATDQDILVYGYEPRTKRLVLHRQRLG